MLSFIGDYLCKADNKFRIVVPSSFRKGMMTAGQTVFVLRKNIFESCIDMYPYNEWELLVAGLGSRLSSFDRKHAAFLRELYRGAQEVEMDGNGRILIPRRLLEDIGVDREMILVGQNAKIEIWESGRYERSTVGGEGFEQLTREVLGE